MSDDQSNSNTGRNVKRIIDRTNTVTFKEMFFRMIGIKEDNRKALNEFLASVPLDPDDLDTLIHGLKHLRSGLNKHDYEFSFLEEKVEKFHDHLLISRGTVIPGLSFELVEFGDIQTPRRVVHFFDIDRNEWKIEKEEKQ